MAADSGDAGGSGDAGLPTPGGACLVGVTNQETSELELIDDGDYLPMYGSGQAGLTLALAVRATGPEDSTLEIVVTSDQGEATITYLDGGRAQECSGEVCEFLFLFVPTRDLVEDPDDLADLQVSVEVTLSTDDEAYCVATLGGRLRRADLIESGAE